MATKQLLHRLLDVLPAEAPWAESDLCQECGTKFTLTMRKHHWYVILIAPLRVECSVAIIIPESKTEIVLCSVVTTRKEYTIDDLVVPSRVLYLI